MRKLLIMAAVAIMFMALSSAATYADTITLAQGQSLTFNFQPSGFPNTSATATLTLNGNLLTVNLTNTSTDGTTRIKGIGLDTTPNLNITSFSATGGMSAFQFSTGGGGMGNMEAVASSAGNKTLIQSTNNNSNTGTVVFTLASAPTSLTLDQVAVHFISLPNGQSIKVNGTCTNCGAPPPTNPVPEPATMLLLGTGLAGVAASLRKRHKGTKK